MLNVCWLQANWGFQMQACVCFMSTCVKSCPVLNDAKEQHKN